MVYQIWRTKCPFYYYRHLITDISSMCMLECGRAPLLCKILVKVILSFLSLLSQQKSDFTNQLCECLILRRTSWTQGCTAHTCVRPRRSTGPVPGSIRRRRDRTGDICWVRPGQALHLSPHRAVAVVNTHTHTKVFRDMQINSMFFLSIQGINLVRRAYRYTWRGEQTLRKRFLCWHLFYFIFFLLHVLFTE